MADDKDIMMKTLNAMAQPKGGYWSKVKLTDEQATEAEKDLSNPNIWLNEENYKMVMGDADGTTLEELLSATGRTMEDIYIGTYEAVIDGKKGVSLMDATFKLFDPLRRRFPHEPLNTGVGMTHIFITKPSLNLEGIGEAKVEDDHWEETYDVLGGTDSNGITTNIHHLPLVDFYLNSSVFGPVCKYIVKMLDYRYDSLGGDSTQTMMPLLSSFAEDFNGLPSLNYDTHETGETYEGRTQKFIKSMEGSYGGPGDGTITFFDNAQMFVMLTMLIWTSYQGAVAKGLIRPKLKYSLNNRADYVFDVYYVRTMANYIDINVIAKFAAGYWTEYPQNILDGMQGGNPISPQMPFHFHHWESNTQVLVNEFNEAAGHIYGNDPVGGIWGQLYKDGPIAYNADSLYSRLSNRPYITDDGKLLWLGDVADEAPKEELNE